MSKTGDERQSQCENEYGPMQRDSAFKRNILTSQFRNDRDCPERQAQSDHARDHANQRALENKQSHDAAPLRAERHAQRDFAPAAGEAHEQQIRDIAARDQQHGAHRGQQGHESRTQISGHIFRGRDQSTDDQGVVGRFRMLLTITLHQGRHRRLRLCDRNARFQPRRHTHETDSAHQALFRQARAVRMACW